MKSALAIVLLCALCTLPALADISSAHLWVNTTAGGSPSRSSTPIAYDSTHAYGSFQAALTAAQAGDLIGVKNGTYSGQTLSSGGKASFVSFYAETSGSVLVASLSANVDKVHYYGIIASGTGQSRGSLSVIAGSSVFTDILIDGFRGLSGYVQSAGVTVQNAEFGNTITSICGSSSLRNTEDAFRFWSGAYGDPSNDKLLNSEIHDWISDSAGNCSTYGAYDVHADCVQVYKAGSNITISGNKFHGCATNNVQSGGGNQHNWAVENNYLPAPTSGSNRFTMGQADGGTCDAKFRNNVFDVVGYAGAINVDGQASPCTVELSGNIMIGSTAPCLAGSSGAYTQTGGYNVETGSGSCGTSMKHCTPVWLNGTPSSANGYDIRLSNTDTCAIGAGNPASYPATDMYGTTRPQGASPDAGAFEYGAGTAPTITTASLASGTVGVAYSQTLTATPTSPPPAWTVTVGSLPANLSLNSSTGAITGTPNAAATTSFTVTAANGTLPNATKALSITIAAATVAPTISSTSPLPGGTVGTVYNTSGYTFTGTGTPAPTWSATGVPGGLSLSSAGALTGTPTTAGTFTLAVTATNGTAPDATGNFSITIAAPAPSSVSLLGSVSIVGNASIGAAPGAILAYTSPSCAPPGAAPWYYASGTPSAGASWACGAYNATTPPALTPAGCPTSGSSADACTPDFSTYITDPDTGNRILRVTQSGSLSNTSGGVNWYPAASGWIKTWNSDTTKFLVVGDNNRVWWVGFDPSAFKLTGRSGILPGGVLTSWNFSATDPDLVYTISGSNLISYKISTSTQTTIKNFSSITGFVAGQGWHAVYLGADEACAYSHDTAQSSAQGTGRLVACYNLTSGASHMIDTYLGTMDGVSMGINMSNTATMHSVVVGLDGRYVFVDSGYTDQTACDAGPPPPNGAQFIVDLSTGTAAQLSKGCSLTHLAVGHSGDIRQSVGAKFNSAVSYDSRGLSYRSFASIEADVMVSGAYSGAGSNSAVHLSWNNNANGLTGDGNKNNYPILVLGWNENSGGNHQCPGCGELYGYSASTTKGTATMYRFGQTWTSTTSAYSAYDYLSAQISPNGRYALFASDWQGGLDNPGTSRRDFFIMELK